MYHNLTLSHAMWGFLFQLYDMRRPEAKKDDPVVVDGHTIWGDRDEDFAQIGHKATYGFIRPWAEDDKSLWVLNGKEDYYVALSEGMRNGRPLLNTGVKASSFYPERLFVYGNDESGKNLSRDELLKHIDATLGRGVPAYWEPCIIWSGFNRGVPTFHEALRGHTDYGITWWDAMQKLRGKLPVGYDWYQATGCSFGNLDWTDEVVEGGEA